MVHPYLYPPKVILIKFNEKMLKHICDVCGKEVSWRTHVGVFYPAALSQYTFCDDCAGDIVDFLKKKGLFTEKRQLIRF